MKTIRNFVLFFFCIFFVAATAAEPKICLTMIVKNESRIIERCLNQAKGVVDCVSICDTGSTDNTVAIIEDYLKKNKIPGKVHKHEWKNFGHNRSLSIEAAQKTLKELNFDLKNSYLLLLDADMNLQVDPQFTKKGLNKDAYLVMQKSDWHALYNVRLVRASLPWKSVGVTHEYWSGGAVTQENLQTLSIDDREDGGCKADKYERDIRLLVQGLKDEPNNERYMFYLAQSYRSNRDFKEANKWYQARIDKGGWNEEVWYSMLMIGEDYDNMGDWDQALNWYLKAYQYYPRRAESLQKIANKYRHNGNHHLALMFAKMAAKVPYPKDDILFVSHPVYDYLIDEDISISAYYTPHQHEGFDAANRLILKKGVPYYTKDQAYRNIMFYLPEIKATYLPISIKLPLINQQQTETYLAMNPSIQKTENGYCMICRTVNYLHEKGQYQYLDRVSPGIIRTRNFLVEYDKNLNLLSQKEIVETSPRKKFLSRPIEGLEDCRLVKFKNTYYFTCSTADTDPDGQIQISLAQTKEGKDQVEVTKLTSFQSPQNRVEKNWLPFVKDNSLMAIYSYDPFIIYKLKDDGKLEEVKKYTPEFDGTSFRGSAGPIEFDNGYLVLVHEVAFDKQRYYMHRFVYLDKDFNMKKLSKPFFFKAKDVEYCCGMCPGHTNKKIILSIGIRDQEAHLALVDQDVIRSMLDMDVK